MPTTSTAPAGAATRRSLLTGIAAAAIGSSAAVAAAPPARDPWLDLFAEWGRRNDVHRAAFAALIEARQRLHDAGFAELPAIEVGRHRVLGDPGPGRPRMVYSEKEIEDLCTRVAATEQQAAALRNRLRARFSQAEADWTAAAERVGFLAADRTQTETGDRLAEAADALRVLAPTTLAGLAAKTRWAIEWLTEREVAQMARDDEALDWPHRLGLALVRDVDQLAARAAGAVSP